MKIKSENFDEILNISSAISLLCFGLVIFTNNFLWFSFTEGWYSSWVDLGSLSAIYDSGFPFPPVYLYCYKFFLNIFDTISIDRYLGLRIVGILVSILNLYVLFKTLRNLGNSSNFSILISSTSLIIFHSMEALVSYDYTPFNGLFATCLAFLITDRDGFLYFKNFNIIPIVRPLSAVASAIFLIGAKQSTIPIIFVFVILFIFSRKSKLEIFSFVLSGLIFTSLYVVSIGQNIGYESFINIYTNAEYKGGIEKILSRAPEIFSNSASKFNIRLAYSFFKEAILSSVIIIISLFAFGKSLKLGKNNKFYFLKLFVISLLFIIIKSGSILPESNLVNNIRSFRESSVALIIISLFSCFLSFGLLPKLDYQKKFLHLLLTIFCSSLTITNVMSGGTGAFDSFLIICVLGSLVNNTIDYCLKNSFGINKFLNLPETNINLNIPIINKKFPEIKKIILSSVNYSLFLIKVIFFGLIGGTSFAAMADILNKGYEWWGISEKTNYSIINDKLSYVKGSKGTKEILGSAFMSEAQRNFVYRSKKYADKYNLKNILAFPNIPYFYETFDVKPFAQTPLSWIDVTGIKASNKQMREWKTKKPEMIIFNFMNSFVYNVQGQAFLEKGIVDHSFLYLNTEIIEAVKNGDYIILDSYLSNNSGYGIFTLLRSDIDRDLYENEFSKKQNAVLKYLESYYNNALEYLIEEKVEISYLPMVCFEHQKLKMKDFRRKLLLVNDFDCNDTGLGRVKIPGTLNSLNNASIIGLYLKNNNQINDYEESKMLEILKNTKYSNHMSIFSYLLSSYGYR